MSSMRNRLILLLFPSNFFPLRLLSLNLQDFRNVANVSLTFSGDRVFFLGPNGQGKTNLLEAVGLAATLRSFRKSGMDGLVREGQSGVRVFTGSSTITGMNAKSSYLSVRKEKKFLMSMVSESNGWENTWVISLRLR